MKSRIVYANRETQPIASKSADAVVHNDSDRKENLQGIEIIRTPDSVYRNIHRSVG